MDNLNIDLSLSIDSIISIVGIFVSILIALPSVCAVLKSTKKYELTESYRKEILGWYSRVVDLMIKIIHYIDTGIFFEADFSRQKMDILSELSSMIEVGRFYFPNIVDDDNFGNKKPSAYIGYRDINLDFLMRFYRTASKCSDNSNIALLWKLERLFTSAIFEIVEPRERNKEYTKYLSISVREGKSTEDFLNEDPQNLDIL